MQKEQTNQIERLNTEFGETQLGLANTEVSARKPARAWQLGAFCC